ncbi:hypothetical protein N2152v2_002267 [Parachlorella kessleri]
MGASLSRSSSKVKSLTFLQLSPAEQRQLAELRQEAEQLDKEATAFEKHSAELKAKQDAHIDNLKSAEKNGLAKPNYNGGVPDTSKGTKGIVRSTSFNQSDGIKALWRDNEAHADKLSRLEWHQRRLMERQITFDNRCEAFRRANSRADNL